MRNPNHYNSKKLTCPRGHALIAENRISAEPTHGRACKSCDNASRAARRRKLTGAAKEQYIKRNSNERFIYTLREAAINDLIAV